MSVTVCWSAKGGSGTTVVTALMALHTERQAVLIDLDGELPAALGVPEPDGQGLGDWFASDAPPRAVLDLAVAVNASTRLVACGATAIAPDSPRWGELRAWLATSPIEFIVDAGCGEPPAGLLDCPTTSGDLRVTGEKAGRVHSVLVTRACYLSLRRATAMSNRPDGVVLVAEPGRSLSAVDIKRCIGAEVEATVPIDPAIARAVDAGLLAARLPKTVHKAFRPTARSDRARSDAA